MKECVSITEEEYEELRRDQKWLRYLEAAGIDNWEGYDEAMSALRNDDEE